MSIDHPIIEDSRQRITLPASGVTSLGVPFYFQINDDIEVALETTPGSLDWTILDEGVGYTLTGAGVNAGGTATLLAPADGLRRYRVRGRTLLDRVTSVIQAGAVKGKALDTEFDRTRLAQMELRRDADETLLLQRQQKAAIQAYSEAAVEAAGEADEAKQIVMAAIEDGNAYLAAAIIARNETVAAKDTAVTAKNDAVTAKNETVTARGETIAAKDDAVAAKGASETARDQSVTAKNDAVTAKNETVTARGETIAAKDDAVAAQGASETARDQSVTAKNEVVTAKNETVTARADAVAAAGAAEESATEAGISETAAGGSAVSAGGSAIAAAGTLTDFRDRYLGAASGNPTVAPSGAALAVGMIYWNTVAGEMRAYNGSAWVVAYNPAEGAVESFNGRTGAIVPQASDYDAYFMTPTEVAAGYLGLAGGTLTDYLTLSGYPAEANHAVNKGYVDNFFMTYSGGTLTNYLTLHSDPSSAMHAATKQYVDGAITTAAGARQATSEKNQPNGYAGLDAGGKISVSQLPATAINDTFVINSQAAMLALTAQVGDVAVRTDLSKSFILRVEPATTLANWQELLTPVDAVLSVAGKTGIVTLVKGDVGLGNVDNTSDVNKPVSTAQAAAIAARATAAQGAKADSALQPDVNGQVVTGGVNVDRDYMGNTSGGNISIDPGNGPIQQIVNGGAAVISPASGKYGICTLIIQNSAGSAALTFTGYTRVGSLFDNAAASRFACTVIQTQDVNWLIVTKVL